MHQPINAIKKVQLAGECLQGLCSLQQIDLKRRQTKYALRRKVQPSLALKLVKLGTNCYDIAYRYHDRDKYEINHSQVHDACN